MKFILMWLCLIYALPLMAKQPVDITFGRFLIGQKVDEIKKIAPNFFKSCESVPNQPNNFDCEVSDKDGTYYQIEGDELVRKEVRNINQYRGIFPLGIKPSATIVDVLRKSNDIVWFIGVNPENRVVISTDYVIEEAPNVKSQVYFIFNMKQKLISFGSMVLTN